MEFDNNCPMDEDYPTAEKHGISHEDFVKYSRDFFCPRCPNRDCYAKREYNTKS